MPSYAGSTAHGLSIPIHEWLFTEVPEEELEACFYYENARDDKLIQKCVFRWRNMPEDVVPYFVSSTGWSAVDSVALRAEGLWRELASLTDQTFAQLLVNLPGFPERAWQQIPVAKRNNCTRFISFYRDLDNIRGGARLVSIEEAVHCSRWPVKNRDVLAFVADPHGGVDKMVAEIGAEVRKRYQQLRQKPRDPYSAWLKQLGAKRLKESFKTWPKAIAHSISVTGEDTPLYYGHSEVPWRKARLQAIKRAAGLFPIKRAH